MKLPAFENLAAVVRDLAGLNREERIDPDIQVLRDLRIVGKRSVALLKAIECHYGIEFRPELYDQVQNERTIRSEDQDEGPVIQSLLGNSMQVTRSLTVASFTRPLCRS